MGCSSPGHPACGLRMSGLLVMIGPGRICKRRGLFYYSMGRIFTKNELFIMMGWAMDSFDFPEGLSDSSINSMLGNMLIPPVVGGALMAVLKARATSGA